MIVKHKEHEKTKKKLLLERLNMKYYENEMEQIIYEEFRDTLHRKDEAIRSKDEEIKKLKENTKEYINGLQELNNDENLNPEAKKK